MKLKLSKANSIKVKRPVLTGIVRYDMREKNFFIIHNKRYIIISDKSLELKNPINNGRLYSTPDNDKYDYWSEKSVGKNKICTFESTVQQFWSKVRPRLHVHYIIIKNKVILTNILRR